MILEFVEDIFGRMIPSRFGGPVQHLSQEPLFSIILQRFLGGWNTPCIRHSSLVECLCTFMGLIDLNVLTSHVKCFVQHQHGAINVAVILV